MKLFLISVLFTVTILNFSSFSVAFAESVAEVPNSSNTADEPEIDFGPADRACIKQEGVLGTLLKGDKLTYYIRVWNEDDKPGDTFEMVGKDKDIKTLVGSFVPGDNLEICAKPVKGKTKTLSVETLERAPIYM